MFEQKARRKKKNLNSRVFMWLVLYLIIINVYLLSVVYADDESFVLGATTSLGVGTAQFTSNILSGAPAFQNVFNPVARGTDFVVGSALYAGGEAIGYGISALRGGATTNAYKTALEGGRHAPMLKQYSGKTDIELTRGIRSYEKQISLHQEKIMSPRAEITDWEKLSSQEQKGYLNKWQKDTQRLTEQRDVLKGILGERKR